MKSGLWFVRSKGWWWSKILFALYLGGPSPERHQNLSTVWPLEVVISALNMFIAILSNIAVLPIAKPVKKFNWHSYNFIHTSVLYIFTLLMWNKANLASAVYMYIQYPLSRYINDASYEFNVRNLPYTYILNKMLSSFLTINS